MALIALKEYGYKTKNGTTGLIADWSCTVCDAIAYPETNIVDIPSSELNAHGCRRCKSVLEAADRLAEEWWAKAAGRFYYKAETGNSGAYGLRDDLFTHLIGRRTTPALATFARRLGVELPGRIDEG